MASRYRGKVEIDAMLGSDIESFFRKNKQYGQFEDGTARCYVCSRNIDIGQVAALSFRDRREDEPAIYRDKTLLQKILGRPADRIDFTIKYCCESFPCYTDFIHREGK